MKRTVAAACAVLALTGAPAAVQAQTPPGFFGISPQGTTSPSDFELMAEAGVRSVRVPLYWSQVEPITPYAGEPDWESFDRDVELAARYEMEVLPAVWGTPSWVAPELRLEPTRGWQLRAWASFLRQAVRRYGPGGSLWSSDPDLPYMPIRRWEIWNEPNIVTFGRAAPRRFADLLRVSGRIVHAGGGEAILGGLFGRPLQIPPNVGSGRFLNEVYRARRVKPFFDGVALHPYVSDAGAMRAQIRNLRRVMRVHNDAATPLYVTELGWGSASFESRWERGPRGQAEELAQAFSMLAGHRRSWRIGGAWWFSWTDALGSCQFCDSAGLLNEQREAKPAWYEFTAWTGGDPEIVPRATLFE
jgi:polysaccharide biosynthesis protein PslG